MLELERHYTVNEIAEAWNISADSVRRLFADEPGVLHFGKPSFRKRAYRPLRVPQHVVDRVYRRLTIGAEKEKHRI